MTADNLRELATRTLLSRFADMCEGAVIVDAEARVVWMNERYPARLGIADPAAAIGLPIEQVIPNSLMRQVIESGRPIMLDIMDFGDESFVVNRLPLRDDAGAIIGAVGFVLYDDPRHLAPVFSRYQRLRADLQRPSASWPRRAAPSTVFPVLSGLAGLAKSSNWPDALRGRPRPS
jgi:transcriptional regulator with PAS, ATPase and Fis domain